MIKPLQAPKRFLFGPGPSPVHPRVYEAMRQPIVGHLDPYFFQVNEEIRSWLKMCFGTQNEFTMVISGTGSAGMECAVTNFVEPGAKVAIFVNGYFSERLTEMARRHGAVVARLEKPWGQTYTDSEVTAFIAAEKPRVVAFVQAETSTGAYQPGHAICKAAHDVGALVIADCVTSLGGMPVDVDEAGIDIAYSGTQKALGCPPGLAPITCSPRALEWLRVRAASSVSWYLDLKLLLDYYESAHRYHHTAPISMFYALREALAIIADEGLETRWARHKSNHEKFRGRASGDGYRDVGREGPPPVDSQHPARARGRQRRKRAQVADGRARNRNRWRLRAADGKGVPDRHHGIRVIGGERSTVAQHAEGRAESRGLQRAIPRMIGFNVLLADRFTF